MNVGFQMNLFMWMLFMHCIGDFLLQKEWLANYKQKSTWEKHPQYNDKYKCDYIVPLFVHSFIYSVCINIQPLFMHWKVIGIIPAWWAVIASTVVHMIIDHLKANKMKINLIQDQALHIVWIDLLALIYTIPVG